MTTNIRLSDAIDQYVAHMRAKGKKDRTVHNHMQPLRRCLVVWGNIYTVSIRHNHMDSVMGTPTWGPSTRNLYLGNLRGGFFPWLRRMGYMQKDLDPSDGWSNATVIDREKSKSWAPMSEFKNLLLAAPSERDRAVVAIGLFTMGRGGEVTALKVKDARFDTDEILLFREKTSEEDLMPMSNELRSELLLWMRHYEERMGRPLDPEWYLVPAQGPCPMIHDPVLGKLQRSGAPALYKPTQRLGRPYNAVKRTVTALGMDDFRIGVHYLRRSAARAYYDRLVEMGHDQALMKVGAILGHKDTKTTQIYLGIRVEREQRNAMIGGKDMFPGMWDSADATITQLRKAN